MSRSGYSDSLENWDLIRWRGAVRAAIRGKRGQAFLRELLAALDAMPEKELIGGELVTADGDCCTLGALGLARGLDMSTVDYNDPPAVAEFFGIAHALAAEIEFLNDEDGCWRKDEPAARWRRMRQWVAAQIYTAGPAT